MKQYLDLVKDILTYGEKCQNRTGVDTLALFGYQYRCRDVAEHFPLLTTKEVNFRALVVELLWKLSGSTNIKPLVDQKVHIWNEWPFQNWLKETNQESLYPKYSAEWKTKQKEFVHFIATDAVFAKTYGELGPTYGHHMRSFGQVFFGDLPQELQIQLFVACDGIDASDEFVPGVDQIDRVIETIKNDPDNRRIIMTLWNPHDNEKTLLPPCPCFYHFRVLGGKLHLQVYQRSSDTFLGVPFNTAQEALLLMMVAHVCQLPAGDLIHTFGDAHIYVNHISQIEEQLLRMPKKLPKVELNPYARSINDFLIDDIHLIGYDPHPKLKGEVAV